MEVFAILDDVDQLGQLDAMAKETGWFGPGSRIIVTTQDKRLLKEHGINHIYEVQFPLFYEALQIFCMYAFRQRSPYDGFENLAWEVTELAGKLPLGLKVMGSYFRGMSKHEWEKILPRLRTSLDGKSESILNFSYDALREEEKDIFLYIACLFNYEPAEKVEAHLATKFPDVRQGLHILSDKSIISISSGYVKMHDMLEKLGREIVRKQSICDPEQRRFLVNGRDTCDVLSNYTVGSRSVVGINSKYSEIKDELDRSCRAFEKMYTLQFLRLHGNDIHPRSYLPQSLKYLPRDIKLLHWECFPMTCLPSNFDPRFLIELNMSYSQLENLWEGFYVIRNLKWMDLKCSKNLKELPDLSTATSLKELNLEDCSSLVELPASLGNATNLEILNLSGCSNLKMLPSCIGNATNLRELFLRSCSSLVKLPSSIGNITCLKDLNLSGCSSLVTLPSSTGNIIGLKNLILSECSSLVKLPSSIGKITGLKNLVLSECSSLVELPSSIGHITGLHNLNVSNCLSLKELPSSIGNITNLEKLYLNGCSKLEALPNDINMVSLDVLDLADCSMLKTFPEISKNIRVLILNGTAIEEVPSSIKSWPRLDNLHMSYHENLNDFPHVFDIITELHLSDTGIQEIAPWVKQISRLRVLVIKGCTKLVSLPELPESLAFLNAENCESLERLHCSFHTIKFIGLNFVNCFKLNQEARDLIIKTSACRFSLFPGEKVPTYFTYRATGNSLSMKWNGIDTFPRSLSFKACVLLVNKGDVEVGDRKMVGVSYCLKEKHNGDNVNRRSRRYHHGSPLLKEHLYTFHVDVEVSSNEFFFDFEVYDKKWEIGESGLNLVPTL